LNRESWSAHSATAWAEGERGLYLQALVGLAQSDISRDALDTLSADAMAEAGVSLVNGSSTLDKSDLTYGFAVGYSLSRHFAVEAGYVSLGKSRYRTTGSVTPPGSVTATPANLDVDISTKGPTLAIAGFAPLGNRFDLHARGGLMFSDTTATVAVSAAGTADQLSASDRSRNLFYGVGASFKATPRISLGLDHLHYQGVFDQGDAGDASVNALAASVTWRVSHL
jgi:OmpA-like transmembrane domain